MVFKRACGFLLTTVFLLTATNVGNEVALAAVPSSTDNMVITSTSKSAAYTDMSVIRTNSVSSLVTDNLTGWVKYRQLENSHTVGWLQIPGTTINTQIVQAPYELGNNYYLRRNFYGEMSKNGTYCADRRDQFGGGTRSELSRNTILYAHSWDDDPNGPMFSQLKKYKDPEFAREHPYIYFATDTESMVWEVFAVFHTSMHFPYVWPELPDNVYSQVMNTVYASSIYDYGIRVSNSDKVITLSTCTYIDDNGNTLPTDQTNEYRFVIMARLVDSHETAKDQANFTINPQPLTVSQLPNIPITWVTDSSDEAAFS